MSLKLKFTSILALTAAIFVFSTGALAQEVTPTAPEKTDKMFKGERKAGKLGRHKKGHGMRAMFRDLNLTDAQKEQFKQIREANKPDEATIAELKAIKEARKAGTALTPEQEQKLKAFREQRQAKAKSVHEQMLNILTAEQKTQMEKNKADMKLKREEFRKQRELRREKRQAETPKVN